ncbi:hypothetical protein Aoki45_15680 [Algoriphagus sp. oki45]|uniref:hypothetical protein n=1 Tax=Algoriphagus sp. oki45 TaxID=3067294 RepID=UPI0027ECF9B6|nr:hypothetical protein Aoki45_15680 [Algoriphagus sp. oki45]
MQIHRAFQTLFSIFLFSFSFNPVFAQEEKRLFDTEEALELEMSTSIKRLRSETNDSTFITQDIAVYENGTFENYPFEIRTRGNFRLENCYYPPTRIRMAKDDAKGSIFQGTRKLKLVLPCSKGKNSGNYVGKEYLAYKMYELVTDYYFRTRLVKMKFTNLDDKKGEQEELLGFVIEDDDDVAQRFDAEISDKKIPPNIMEDTATVIHDFFQMMIGNTDWSGLYQHNQKVMIVGQKTIYPLAYDFDMCGLVNPPYAQVNSAVPISKVTERLYRGFCRDESLFQYVRQHFLDRESELMGLIDQYQDLYTSADLKAMKSFVSEFFGMLKSDKLFKDRIVSSCRNLDGSYSF